MTYSFGNTATPIGAIIALGVCIVALVLGVTHNLDPMMAGLFIALGLSRLI